MHIQFVAENCTSLLAVAVDDEDAPCSDCCSMAVDAAVVVGGIHGDSSAELHPATRVGVLRVQDGCSSHSDGLFKF